MQEGENIQFYSFGDIWKLLNSFIRYCIKKWRLLLVMAILGISIGLLYYTIQPPKFEAASNFILEEKQGGIGGLGGIASQFGFDLGGIGGGGGLFSGDNILDILKSKKVVFSVLRAERTPGERGSLADLYLEFSGLSKQLKKRLKTTTISIPTGDAPVSALTDSILTVIYEKVKKKHLQIERINKKGSIIQVTVTSPNNSFSRLMSEGLVTEAGKLYLSIKNQSALSNISRMQRRSDSLLSVLNGKSYNVASKSILDANPGARSTLVPVEIATRDKAVVTALYTEVTKNLEASKLILSQQTPVIQVLDTPAQLLPDKKNGIVVVTLIGAITLTMLTVIVLFIGFIRDRIRPI